MLGRVAAPFGVRGWVKVVPFTASAEALLDYPEWRMTPLGEREARAYRVLEGRVHGGAVVAALEGVATREQAARLRGATVAVPREAMPPADDGEVYLADLPGCRVVNARGVPLGEVVAVDGTGAQPLLRVAAEGRAQRLIPLVVPVVLGVDLAARVVEVDWEAEY